MSRRRVAGRMGLGLGAAAVLAACGRKGSEAVVRVVTLDQPAAELRTPFTNVMGVRELEGGKVLVLDARERTVQLVDLASGESAKVGSQGQGPGEYVFPIGLFALPAGKSLLYDIAGRRFLVIDAMGKPGEIITPPDGAGMMAQPGGVDDSGRVYFQSQPSMEQMVRGKGIDSLAILRWDRVSASMDTAGWMAAPKIEVSGGGDNVSIGGSTIFSAGELWGLAVDGSVARVVPDPYHVVWYRDGKAVAGPVQPYEPIPVTEADRTEFKERRKTQQSVSIAIGGGGTQITTRSPTDDLPALRFAETKPPFLPDPDVLVTPEGDVWVLRTRAAGDAIPVYDVFGRSGNLTMRVKLRPESAVVGFGPGKVYVTRTDADDLRFLQVFKR